MIDGKSGKTHSSIEPDEVFGPDETETRLYFPQMCMMNTDPMNISDKTKTGTGPILIMKTVIRDAVFGRIDLLM